jgi:hypothetical protein
MTNEGRTRQLCCEGSLEVGEQLFATASRVDVWLLLEYNAAWGAKALPESGLPDDIKAFLNRQLETIPNARFQFIKQERKSTDRDGVRFYVARSAPGDAALYRFALADEKELLTLGIPAILRGDYESSRIDETLFLICTNGKRDLACARYGIPLYRAMSKHSDESTWQTIHLGGHRFAGTMACVPEGLFYGRVGAGDVEQLINAYRAGQIDPHHYRGRSSYDPPVQAAEYFLRERTGNTDIGGLELKSTESAGADRWQVTFAMQGGLYSVTVSSRLSDFELYESTANTEKNRVPQYYLEDYETRTSHP